MSQRRMRPWEWWAAGGIALLMLGLKLGYHPDLRLSIDGTYYLNVARHVADGEGLRTTLSLYRQGFSVFPHPTPIYPLWPLTLGAALAVAGLDGARFVSESLYVIDLILLFALARLIAVRVLEGPARAPEWVRPGVVAILVLCVFAANHVLFRATSLPYTEPLALALTFACLLSVVRYSSEPHGGWAALAGVFAGLAYLTRSQCAGLVLGVLGAFTIVALRDRRVRIGACVFLTGVVSVVIPWVVQLAGVLEPFDPRVLLDFAAYRSTPELPAFPLLVETESAAHFVLDRLSGIRVAFDPTSSQSYMWSWGPVAYVPVCSLVLLALRPRTMAGWWKSVTSIENSAVVATVLAGIATLVPVHLLHSVYVHEWWFGERYGLFLVLVVVVTLPHLLNRGHYIRLLVVCLIGISLVRGGVFIAAHYSVDRPAVPEERIALEEWLAQQSTDTTIMSVDPQPLSIFSEAGFHWIQCSDPPAHTRLMLESFPIDYVIVFPYNRDCPFVRGLSSLDREIVFGTGESAIEVLRVGS